MQIANCKLQIGAMPNSAPPIIRRKEVWVGLLVTGCVMMVALLPAAQGELPAELPDKPDITGFSSRERTKVSWGWWQPASMSNPRFFFRHHQSDAVQGWAEGWWVNGATNEVYAFIGG